MFYCEECGAKIIPGSRFCEECGTPVPEDEWTGFKDNETENETTTAADSLFTRESWKNEWAAVSGTKGLILYNSYGASSLDSFEDALSKYVEYSRNRGMNYYTVDLMNQAVTNEPCDKKLPNVLELLKSIYTVSLPDYVILIGDEKSIGDIAWKNESADGDEYVYSDLPFVTFDLDSPFTGKDYSFSDLVSVGRIPCSSEDDFSVAVRYLNNVIKFNGTLADDKALGLAAFVWKSEAEACFSSIGKRVLCSPDVDLQYARKHGILGLSKGEEPSLLYFNLHGSDQTPYWYGQKGQSYPEVMDPAIIGEYVNGYFLGVEACYGARYHDLKTDESILLSALSNGCLGFLGSSMIAYGTSEEPGCCADILIREYLKLLKQGHTSGHAYLGALEQLCKSEMDDATIKTLAEFALYGDPSLGLFSSTKSSYRSTKTRRTINVPIPNVRNAVNYSLCTVSEKIDSILIKYLEKQHSDFINSSARHYFDEEHHIGQTVYEKDCGFFKQYLKVYYDFQGTIKTSIISK